MYQVEEAQIFDDLTHPSICESPEHVRKSVKIFGDAYSATDKTHALIICTEWDEFIVSKALVVCHEQMSTIYLF